MVDVSADPESRPTEVMRETGVVIRTAMSNDLAALTDLRLRFLAEHRQLSTADLTDSFASTTRQYLERHHRAHGAVSWLATSNDDAVAAVTMLLLDLAPRPFEESNTEGYIVNMYVAPPFRRRGIGQRLLDECEHAARELGLRKVMLVATDDGLPLYRRNGFVPNDRWMERRP
jgi:GNAT superfamily N-acetyltransferase